MSSHGEVFRQKLVEITASNAFRGSRRSQEFLQHIVEKALSGQFHDLKERAIGIELFGRAATYDTGGDAIVRVTASEVRRRLAQFHAEAGAGSTTRIDLPSGSYIPEFREDQKAEVVALPEPAVPEIPVVSSRWSSRAMVMASGLFGLLVIAAGLLIWTRTRPAPVKSDTLEEPWSTLFRADRQTRLVLCDPDISKVQGLLGFQISLSDYANHRYFPEQSAVSTDLRRAISTLRGVDVAAVDASIAMHVSELGFVRGQHIRTHTARSLQLNDFKVDDNFIVLGSPRSNPWSTLFNDDLDFRFDYDPALRQELIRNVSVRSGEADTYVPTAQGWETGYAYAIIALVRNPGQGGHVLLLAGSNAEATEAAGKLALNHRQLSDILRRNGLDTHGSPEPFEILLRAATMAGSSNTIEVVACHKLAAQK